MHGLVCSGDRDSKQPSEEAASPDNVSLRSWTSGASPVGATGGGGGSGGGGGGVGAAALGPVGVAAPLGDHGSPSAVLANRNASTSPIVHSRPLASASTASSAQPGIATPSAPTVVAAGRAPPHAGPGLTAASLFASPVLPAGVLPQPVTPGDVTQSLVGTLQYLRDLRHSLQQSKTALASATGAPLGGRHPGTTAGRPGLGSGGVGGLQPTGLGLGLGPRVQRGDAEVDESLKRALSDVRGWQGGLGASRGTGGSSAGGGGLGRL
jgi:hypothetical protein